MNKFNFNELNNYMFFNDNITKYNQNYKLKNNSKIKNKDIKNKNKNNYLENTNYFKPTEKDKLFWCFFIIINNFNHYLLNKNNLFKIEKEFKIDLISRIRNIKPELKKYKIKINEVENELVSDDNITLNIINVLSLIYKKSVIIMKKNIYCFFNYGNENVFIIEKINNDYVLHLERNNENDVNNIKNNKLLVDYKKPIKSISFYKLGDLQEIAEKLKINIIDDKSKKKTKKGLYEEILNKIEN
jgi:hypothetical protein